MLRGGGGEGREEGGKRRGKWRSSVERPFRMQQLEGRQGGVDSRLFGRRQGLLRMPSFVRAEKRGASRLVAPPVVSKLRLHLLRLSTSQRQLTGRHSSPAGSSTDVSYDSRHLLRKQGLEAGDSTREAISYWQDERASLTRPPPPPCRAIFLVQRAHLSRGCLVREKTNGSTCFRFERAGVAVPQR